MAIQRWSETVVGAILQDDPGFTEDLDALIDELTGNEDADVILDLSSVRYINSSNITKLLKLHQVVVTKHGRVMKLCAVPSEVRGVFHVSGLVRSFQFAPDVRDALATLQDRHK